MIQYRYFFRIAKLCILICYVLSGAHSIVNPKKLYANSITDRFIHSLILFQNNLDAYTVEQDKTNSRKAMLNDKKNQKTVLALIKPKPSVRTEIVDTPLPSFEHAFPKIQKKTLYDTYKTMLQKADTLVAQNKERDAIAQYTDAIALAPQFFYGYLQRAKALIHFKKDQLAIQDLSAALRLNNTNVQSYYLRSKLYTKSMAYANALQDIHDALEHAQEKIPFLEEKAAVLFQLNDYKSSINIYTKLLTEYEPQPYYYYHRALAYAGTKNFQKLISDYLNATHAALYYERTIQLQHTIMQHLGNTSSTASLQPKTLLEPADTKIQSFAFPPAYNPFDDAAIPYYPPYIAREIKAMQMLLPSIVRKKIQSLLNNAQPEYALQEFQKYIQIEGKNAKKYLIFLAYIHAQCKDYTSALLAYKNAFKNKLYPYTAGYNFLRLSFQYQDIAKTAEAYAHLIYNVEGELLHTLEIAFSLGEGKLHDALSLLETYNKRNDISTLMQKASIAYIVGEESKTAYYIGKLNAIRSKNALARAAFLEGLIAITKKNTTKAIQLLEKAYSIDPIPQYRFYATYIDTRMQSNNIAYLNEMLQSSTDTAQKLLLLSIRGTIEYNLGYLTQSLITFNNALTLETTDAARMYFNIALVEYAKEYYDKALNTVQRYIYYFPKDPMGYALCGAVYLAQKNLNLALKNFLRSLELNPNNAALYPYLILAMTEAGKSEEAQELYGKILGSSENTMPILSLALTNLIDGNIPEAIEYATQGLQQNPTALAYVIRGLIYLRINNQKVALEDFTEGLALEPNNATLLILSAEALEAQKQYPRAIEQLNKAITLKPLATEAYVLKGLLECSMGLVDTGVETLQTAIELFRIQKDTTSRNILQQIVSTITLQ